MQSLDEKFMQRAFQLAQMGRFSASPNPRVGAVIVHNNKIIGEGFHQNYGEPHAEVNAVESVQNKSLLSDATIYVTLEPCAHFGKTPPCADLLVKHNFKRVVIANQDPFEKVNGGGISKLKTAGIKVETNCLSTQGEEVNKRFFTFHRKKRPYIILKWAETEDGFIGRLDGGNGWITNSVSKQLVHQWRAEEDAILVGKNTVLADNPDLTVREVHGKNPVRFVVDRNLELSKNANIFNSKANTVILNSVVNKKEENLNFVVSDLNASFLEDLCDYCYANKLQSIIIEGGANILNQFIVAELWDEARVFVGAKKFTRGIKAPILNNLSYTQQVINDQLSIYKNRKQ